MYTSSLSDGPHQVDLLCSFSAVTCCTGCPRLIGTVFEKNNIKNIKPRVILISIY